MVSWSMAQFMPPTPTIKGQLASPEDMRIFQPYVGTWKGKSFTTTDGRSLHFLVIYSWYDRSESIIHLRIKQVDEDKNESIQSIEGYYGYDPINKWLYHYGFSVVGGTGFGAVLNFDHATKNRSTTIVGMNPNGKPLQIRDQFTFLDENTFENKSYSWKEGSWKLVNEGVYKRSKE